MGPNTLDEFLQVVAAEYDPVADRTAVRFRYVRPDEHLRICRDEIGLLRLMSAADVAQVVDLAQLAGAR
jgi:hypothetical protein